MPIPLFRVTVAEIGNCAALVSVSGELDLYVEGELRGALDAARFLGMPTTVVDLSAVTFMDSTVCGILLEEAKRRRSDDGELMVVSNGNGSLRVLEVSGVDQLIGVKPTLHAAFEELMLEQVS